MEQPEIVNYKYRQPVSQSDTKNTCVIFASLGNAILWARKQSYARVTFARYGTSRQNVEYTAINEFHPYFKKIRDVADLAGDTVYYVEANRRHEILNLPEDEELREKMKEQMSHVDFEKP